MVELRLSEIADRMKGKILQGAPSLVFTRYNIDSRLTQPGELFFALIAGRNGHDFVSDAARRGAAGAVISRGIPDLDRDFAFICVEDTLEALQRFARSVLGGHPVKVIGITGSIGKTTTKEFAAALLARSFEVLKSQGNFNNQIGLSLSLLELNAGHEVAVLEMGMNHPGEIKTLTGIAPPDVAVITNISPVHLEFFSSLDDIALAKKEILDGLKPGGLAVLNGDDPRLKKIAAEWKGRKILFGHTEDCNVRAQDIQKQGLDGISCELIYGEERQRINLSFLYTSYLSNFLAAAGIAFGLGVPLDYILTQVQSLRLLPGRGTLIQVKELTLLDDTYNSNPKALESALKDLSGLPARRKVAVLGDMRELGKDGPHFHREAGRQVAEFGWDVLITVGPLSQGLAEAALASGMTRNQVYSFLDSEKAAAKIWSLIEKGDFILVKGSRAIKTEKIVDTLKKRKEA